MTTSETIRKMMDDEAACGIEATYIKPCRDGKTIVIQHGVLRINDEHGRPIRTLML